MIPKLLLVSLRDEFMDSDRVMPPLGIMSLKSYMDACGIECDIENTFDFNDISKYKSYSHIGISCMTPQKAQAYVLLSMIKKQLPKVKVIIGGSHTKFYLDDCTRQPFDYIIVGDGEVALQLIMFGLTSERIVSSPIARPEIMNQLPLPHREPSFLNQYEFVIQGIRMSTVMTAKGCPMACAFCEDAGTTPRLYTADNVGRQIDQVKRAGYGGVMFFDDIFCMSINRVKELCEVIKTKDIYFRCFAHAKSFTEEMADILYDAGCIEIGYGAESGSQKILDNVNKKTTVEQNRQLVKICNDRKIKVKAFMMLGLPGETSQTVAETAYFLQSDLLGSLFVNRFGKTCTNDFDLSIYFPYKGTTIRDSIDKGDSKYDLTFEHDPEAFRGIYKGLHGQAEAVVRTTALTAEDIASMKEMVYSSCKSMVHH